MALTLNQAFDPRKNSIGFLRWLMAFAVIFSHAGPIAGFYGGHDLGLQLTEEQSIGGVAVAGFFFISGFLITKSRQGKSTIFRYFWRRIVRIFPAFWTSLLLVVFVIAPLCWRKESGSWGGYWDASFDSPWSFLTSNALLRMNQTNIAGMGSSIPLGQAGGYEWNGSAWTLIYEFKGYILIGLFGLFGILGYRWLAAAAFGFLLVLNLMLWGSFGNFGMLSPLLDDYRNVMVLTPFFFGMVFALFGDKIRIDDRIALGCAGVAVFTYAIASGWLIYGQFAFLYCLMWAAVRLPLTRWEKYGDLSYGIYIYAWPIMQMAAYFGLHEYGWFVYHLTIVVAIHLAAWLSWHVIESPALARKNWTPGWLESLLERGRPLNERLKRKIVNPKYSSTRYGETLSNEEAGAATEPPGQSTATDSDDLVTHNPADRSRR